MRRVLLLGTIVAAAAIAGIAQAPTKVVFAKGANSKTLNVTIPAKGERTYSLAVSAGQVINVDVAGDIFVSKTNEFPVISLNLVNGIEDGDQWQDGEGYLSVLTGRKAAYIISVANSSGRARTFQLTFKVTDDPEDYVGGTPVDQ